MSHRVGHAWATFMMIHDVLPGLGDLQSESAWVVSVMTSHQVW
jgi:hypothetical protein